MSASTPDQRGDDGWLFEEKAAGLGVRTRSATLRDRSDDLPGHAFFACDPVAHEGLTNTWFSPRDLVSTLGPFDLDPCTQSDRPFDTAARHFCEDRGEDGLAARWEGRVFLNPPYGKLIGSWLDKLAEHGNGVALMFNRTETRWAQNIVARADAVNFIRGRIFFLRRDGSTATNAGTGSMLLAFGAENVAAIQRVPRLVCERSQMQPITGRPPPDYSSAAGAPGDVDSAGGGVRAVA